MHKEASKRGKIALLRFRADLISDYEAIQTHYFAKKSKDPDFIYFMGNSNELNEWKKKAKEHRDEYMYERYEDILWLDVYKYNPSKDNCSLWKFEEKNQENQEN